jgi:hypothetical protein
MKTRLFLALFGSAAIALPSLSPSALAQQDTHSKTWKGVASLRTLRKNGKMRKMKAEYPVFSGSRRVAQVAGLVLKQEAVNGFNGFVKESAEQLPGELQYQYDLAPSLVLNRPRLISATTLFYEFTGGAHGMYGTTGYVFGYPQGEAKPRQLHLADFFSDGAAASKRINDLLMAKLRATKGKEQEAMWVIEGEVKWVPVAIRENFVAEADGLRWYFPPYAVGPYANGEYEVKISSRELGPKFRAGLIR